MFFEARPLDADKTMIRANPQTEMIHVVNSRLVSSHAHAFLTAPRVELRTPVDLACLQPRPGSITSTKSHPYPNAT